MADSERRIFEDPRGRRWRAARLIGASVAAGVAALLALLVWGAVMPPLLRPLALHTPRLHLVAERAPRGRHEPRTRALRVATPAQVTAASSIPRYGFFVDWDDNSFVSLRRNATHLDVLVPEWLRLTDAAGDLVADDAAKETHDRQWLAAHAPALRLTPLVNNFDETSQTWNTRAAGGVLASPAARARFIDGLRAYAARNHDAGIDLDIEQIPEARMNAYVGLVSELARQLHADGRTLDVSAPADDDAYPYKALAAAADHLILMVYDERAVDNAPGPIASLGWFERVLDRRFADIDSAKLVVAIGSYGYDWPGAGSGHEVTVQEAWQAASDSGESVAFDPQSLNATLAYDEQDSGRHQVWFLDAASAFNQADAALAMRPGGIALWRLGSEDPGVWSFFTRGRVPNAAASEAMQVMNAGYDLIYDGQGEVLRVTGADKTGARTFDRRPDENLITGEHVSVLPQGLTITRWGRRSDRAIALSFDDGPDPRWTPAILNILRREHVHATFFIIGENADANPELLRRIWREGHDIGSHTYTHPNLGETPLPEARMELNATERLFESELGVRPLLFRPPYAEDIEPETIDDARVLQLSTSLGYTTLGLGIDPGDWKRPGVQAIVDQTVQQAEAGDGNVVLLHDSGGDRSQTIAALPLIIERLRGAGFHLVSTHDLLGLSRAQVATALPPGDRVVASSERLAFSMIHGFNNTMSALFIVGLALGALRFLVISVFASIQTLSNRRRAQRQDDPLPTLSVIVPAYNEEKVVVRTVASLLAADAPPFEIIVVDDGSSDRTASSVRAAFSENDRVRVIVKENGGKASAINAGVLASHSDIVVVIDADTVLAADALRLLAQRFTDPDIGAVAGNAKVGNPVTLLARFQALEYVTSQNLDRRAFDALNAIAVVPGAIGGWRRSALLEIGGFTNDTLAEDADATMKLLRAGWRVVYEPKAVAFTEAPERLKPFVKQRFRWMFGTLQAVFKHRGAALDPSSRGLGWFVIPNVAVFQVFFPLVSPVMDLLMVWSLITGGLTMAMHPGEPMPSGLMFALIFYAAFQLVELAGAAVAFALERDQDWRLLPLVLLQRFCYRQVLYWTAIRALLAAIRGREVGWGKLERTGRLVHVATAAPSA